MIKMINKKKIFIFILLLFFAIEAVLGYKLQTTYGLTSSGYRFGVVVLACLFCLAFLSRSSSYIFTQIALVCTACADFFLIFHPEKRLSAMIFFSVTQIAYFLRLYFEEDNKNRRRIHLTIRASLSLFAILITVIVLGDATDAVAQVSMFYYANLALNLIFATVKLGRNPIFVLGLLLFILCDTVVGLHVIGEYLPISDDAWIYDIIYTEYDLIWLFYVPSQALLAVSLLPDKLKRLSKYDQASLGA